MKRTISTIYLIFTLMTASALLGVEYGGEKSYLHEIPYQVCALAPLPKEAKAKGITVIDTKEAKKLFDSGAYFYDARRQAHIEAGHIKGAKPVLFDVSKARYTVLSLPENKQTALVFYCYGLTCANSYEAALAVREYGYDHVYWYAAGYEAWHGSGLPTER